MKILGIHHVQITIPIGSEEIARQFYCQLLQLPEIEKPPSLQGRGGFWLQVGSQSVHIGVEDGVDRATTKAHIAYQVTNLASWHTHLQQQGFNIKESIPIPGYNRFELRDPFGNRIELIEALGD